MACASTHHQVIAVIMVGIGSPMSHTCSHAFHPVTLISFSSVACVFSYSCYLKEFHRCFPLPEPSGHLSHCTNKENDTSRPILCCISLRGTLACLSVARLNLLLMIPTSKVSESVCKYYKTFFKLTLGTFPFLSGRISNPIPVVKTPSYPFPETSFFIYKRFCNCIAASYRY